MKTIFIVYKTDAWHSYASRDTIGVCTTLTKAISVVKQQAEKEGDAFTKSDDDVWQLDFLKEKLQTQGYKGEGEFQIEELKLNTLL